MQWDFWTLSPESAHQVTFLMTDRGTPKSWRHMNGYSSHTFLWENAGGERFWVKYHFKTEQGIENFTDAEAKAMIADEPDYHLRDLYNAIEAGDAPGVALEMQIMPFDDAPDYRFNPFDLTKVWPHGDYPPVTIGRMVLDRNPENYFAEVEQAAFEPANMVPGIGPAPGQDAARPAVQLPRHAPLPDRHQLPAAADQPRRKARSHSYNKDGAHALRAQRRGPGLRAEHDGGPSPTRRGECRLARRGRRDDARRLHAAPRGRRFRPAGNAGARSSRRPTASTWRATSSATPRTTSAGDPGARVAYWSKVDAGPRPAIAAELGVSNGHGGSNGAPGASDAGSPSAEPQATNAPR